MGKLVARATFFIGALKLALGLMEPLVCFDTASGPFSWVFLGGAFFSYLFFCFTELLEAIAIIY